MGKRNQGRNSPSFQEFAASMMSRIEYRTLSLTERGLLYTLRLECWVNQYLPSDFDLLSKMIGYEVDDVQKAFNAITPFFEIENGFLCSRELENYRLTVQDIRNAQSKGGKTARSNDRKRKRFAQDASSLDASDLNVLSKDKENIEKSKAVFKEKPLDDDWINDYSSSLSFKKDVQKI